MISTTDLVLLPVFGNWLFCQRPQKKPYMYFGDDSIALLLRTTPQRYGRCLDLCSGVGLQALHCSMFSQEVCMVELNPFCCDLARINILMNAVEDRIEVFCGDLYEPVKGKSFETIVANPPLVPFPRQTTYPYVGHGGEDGLSVTWRILEDLPVFLTVRGTARIIGTLLGDGILPIEVKRIEQWCSRAGMDVLLTVVNQHQISPGTELFSSLVESAALTEAGRRNAALAFREMLERNSATHLCSCFFLVRHGSGILQFQDFSRQRTTGFWYA